MALLLRRALVGECSAYVDGVVFRRPSNPPSMEAMTSIKPASWAYAQEFPLEPAAMEAARVQAERENAAYVSAAIGACVRLLAATARARAVVEIGTGTGSCGLWLLDGMPSDGILTTIDPRGDHQRFARTAFTRAGYPSQRTRIIAGEPRMVLPRLREGAYDLIVINGPSDRVTDHSHLASRLVRSGGSIVINNALLDDRIADPAARDETTRGMRTLGRTLRDNEEFMTTLLPVGDGLLVSTKR